MNRELKGDTELKHEQIKSVVILHIKELSQFWFGSGNVERKGEFAER